MILPYSAALGASSLSTVATTQGLQMFAYPALQSPLCAPIRAGGTIYACPGPSRPTAPPWALPATHTAMPEGFRCMRHAPKALGNRLPHPCRKQPQICEYAANMRRKLHIHAA